MVGVAHLPYPEQADVALARLRADLLADPFFKGVPSMQPQQKKTALCFHAKDDLPEVRREVFKLLPEFEATVQVAIMRKRELVASVKRLNAYGYRYKPDAVYDDLVRHAFKNLLPRTAENRICFARRGKTAREQSLRLALAKARTGFDPWQIDGVPRPWHALPGQTQHPEEQIGFPPDDSTILAAYPHEAAGLQVVDYYLWELQRLFEKGEERFFAAVADDYKLIIDLDDKRNLGIGEWYSESNPLTLQKVLPVTG